MREADHILNIICATTLSETTEDPLVTDEGRQTDDLEDELFIKALLEDKQEQTQKGPLQLPVLEFINYFASINLVRKRHKYTPEQLAELGHSTGNSRKPLEQFRKPCVHHEQGCDFQHYAMSKLEVHEANCPYRENATPEERSKVLLKDEALRLWKCTYEGCTKTYTTKKALPAHRETHEANHNCAPKACDQGCTTKRKYNKHVKAYHVDPLSFTPRQCALKDSCGIEKEFTIPVQYNSHLISFHRLDRHERRKYVKAGDEEDEEEDEAGEDGMTRLPLQSLPPNAQPAKKSKKKIRKVFRCPLGGCRDAEKDFSWPYNVFKHLKTAQHNCSEEEAVRLSGVQLKGKRT